MTTAAPPAPPAPRPDEAVFHASWEQALADLELEVEHAEELLRVAHLPTPQEVAERTAWHPPAGLGPLPAPLLDRARTLHARQLDVAHRLAEQAAVSRRHLAATSALRARPAAAPVYLDLEG
ncbi:MULTISPECIES: hypothetical protein [Cellulomonas]|uniref:DUF222 domain-containing protein n=2 Tax=Cellulomonas iranensis TaxID=76862 RepID=A0ABU0GH60_9CELL|nr:MULTISPECIES: hypothetical protein [Cellulomonas]MDQ0424697.1 hypothetical protein [Cellulomonas iranensis]UCN14169.1 hypothetical protein LFM56_14970 [Cellulomonas iranensis]